MDETTAEKIARLKRELGVQDERSFWDAPRMVAGQAMQVPTDYLRSQYGQGIFKPYVDWLSNQARSAGDAVAGRQVNIDPYSSDPAEALPSVLRSYLLQRKSLLPRGLLDPTSPGEGP